MKITDMDMYGSVLKKVEKAVYDLRGLYRRYGYTQFKMSKFEEYELYAHNKDFLVSDGILTFMNTDGKLMALKPDVTLSIAKNSADTPGFVQKMYYNENVYRIDRGTHEFREIMQTGVECMGDVGKYDVYEIIMLALSSLSLISGEYILDISHMGIVQGLTEMLCIPKEEKQAVLACIGEKNVHGIADICSRCGVDGELAEKLKGLASVYGDMDTVLEKLEGIAVNSAMRKARDELSEIRDWLKAQGLDKNVGFDFSIVNDMSYYNGVVFQGFIKGAASDVLSGGRYDNLMAKMGKKSGAIGFAVYLDTLERLGEEEKRFDADVVLLYGENETVENINAAVRGFTAEGLRVSAQKRIPEKLTYRKLAELSGGEVKIIETNG